MIKITEIVRFDHSAVLLINGKERLVFQNISELRKFVKTQKISIDISHIHPAGLHPKEFEKTEDL